MATQQSHQQDSERLDQLMRSLTNVTPDEAQIVRIEDIRSHAKALGEAIIENSKNSRERSTALTKLEESAMWAVKGVVLNG
jgi:hypothetical protein